LNILVTSIIDLESSAYSRLLGLLTFLAENHQVTLISIKDHWKKKQPSSDKYLVGYQNTIDRINIRNITRRKFSPVLQEVLSPCFINNLISGIDYRKYDVHFNYNSLVTGYFVANNMKKIGRSTIFDIADNLPKMIRNSPQIPFGLKYLGFHVGNYLLRQNIRISEYITCVTTHLQDEYNLPVIKTEILPNFVDYEFFRQSTSSNITKNYLNLDNSFVLGFVGTLREWIDFTPIFMAVKELIAGNHDIKILIIGGEGNLDKFISQTKEYGIDDKVVFTGIIPYVKIPEYHRCMDACLMPLKFSNAQPLALLQYLASGKPVISSKIIADIPENIILYANSKEEYVKHIKDIINNPRYKDELIRNGQEYVHEYHSAAHASRKLENMLFKTAERYS